MHVPHHPAQRTATRSTFERLLVTYARAHTRSHAEGLSPPHVDEDLHPGTHAPPPPPLTPPCTTPLPPLPSPLHPTSSLPSLPHTTHTHADDGYWITRRKLHGIAPWPGTGGLGGARDPLRARGTHYFHSTFNDLVLSGLVGIRATDECLELAPLTHLGWWLVRKVKLRGRELDVLYDETGEHYHLGAGLHVWLDGAHVGSAPALPAEDPPSGGGAVGGDPARSAALVPPRVRLAWDSRRFVRCRGTLSSPTPEEWSDC
jgi:hypothetical protein